MAFRRRLRVGKPDPDYVKRWEARKNTKEYKRNMAKRMAKPFIKPKEDFEDFRVRMIELSGRDAPEPEPEAPKGTADIARSIKLYYTELPKHDKVYTLDIVREPKFKDAWYVDFSFGRRGKTLKPGRKTRIAVTLAEAHNKFNTLVKEKKAEGYTENPSGIPFSGSGKLSS